MQTNIINSIWNFCQFKQLIWFAVGRLKDTVSVLIFLEMESCSKQYFHFVISKNCKESNALLQFIKKLSVIKLFSQLVNFLFNTLYTKKATVPLKRQGNQFFIKTFRIGTIKFHNHINLCNYCRKRCFVIPIYIET